MLKIETNSCVYVKVMLLPNYKYFSFAYFSVSCLLVSRLVLVRRKTVGVCVNFELGIRAFVIDAILSKCIDNCKSYFSSVSYVLNLLKMINEQIDSSRLQHEDLNNIKG